MSTVPDYVTSYRAHYQSLLAKHGRERAMELVVGGLYREIGIIQRTMLVALGLKSTDTLVDVGCGSGRLAYALKDHLTGKYVGTDILDETLAYAREKCGRSDWEFHQTFDPVIPMPDKSADLVSFLSVFTHLLDEDIYRFLVEAKRVGKPGASIVFSYFDYDVETHWMIFEQTLADRNPKRVINKFISKSAIRRWSRELGLSIERLIDGPEHWINLPEGFRFDDGRLATGPVEFGQSLAVLRIP